MDGCLDDLQSFAITAGAVVQSPEHMSLYVFTWNLLNAVNGPSPTWPTGDSGANLSCPSPAGGEDPAAILGLCQEYIPAQSPGRGPARIPVVRFIPLPLWSDLYVFCGKERKGEGGTLWSETVF